MTQKRLRRKGKEGEGKVWNLRFLGTGLLRVGVKLSFNLRLLG
jgi:hypothetical protein